MPFTKVELIKGLQKYLSAQDCPPSQLAALGWFDFVNHDAPTTGDPRTMGAAATYALLTDGSGKQREHDGSVMYAILTFVSNQCRAGLVATGVSKGLIAVLSRNPVSEADILEWFHATFPCDGC